MIRFRQICATTLLAAVLAASPALAGEMPFGVTPPPPPPPEAPAMSQTQGSDGVSLPSSTEISATGNTTATIDPLTELTLGLLQSVFSLF